MDPDGTVTQASYEELRSCYEKLRQEKAQSDFRASSFEAKERNRLQQYHGTCKEYFEGVMAEADPDARSDMEPLSEWVKTFPEKPDIVAQAPLARFMVHASNATKRSREESTTLGETKHALSNAMQKLEAKEVQAIANEKRISELISLAADRESTIQELNAIMASKGLFKAKDEFAFASHFAREAMDTLPVSSLQVVTSNASRQANPIESSYLCDFISKYSQDYKGSNRLYGSGSQHALVGTCPPNNESKGVQSIIKNIAAA